ncbi:Hypothetical protein PHPALM_15091 [Phytophthora palmivora]|uniref:Uncharacterized protein n=1 Tax=Phytophthora palmivora TaxID=4796 RepID=A0A2P4XT31_9STRA|nr:Hypothetical protein PHPALM_15091 [Phytophthora palmivora]
MTGAAGGQMTGAAEGKMTGAAADRTTVAAGGKKMRLAEGKMTRPARGKMAGAAAEDMTGATAETTTRPAVVNPLSDHKAINNTAANSESDDGEVAVSSDSEFDPAEFEVSDVDDEDAAISGGSVLTTEGPDTAQKKTKEVGMTNLTTISSLRKERRRTKTWNDRELMRNAHVPVTNLVPEFPTKVFADWEDFDATLQSYMAANYLCLNVRNSESREKYNRYTGCEAGFTVRSVKSIVNGCVAWNVQIVQGTECRH